MRTAAFLLGIGLIIASQLYYDAEINEIEFKTPWFTAYALYNPYGLTGFGIMDKNYQTVISKLWTNLPPNNSGLGI